MPSSGVTVFDSSNREIVRLSDASSSGLEVKASPAGSFMPVSKAVFGRATGVSQKVFSVAAFPNTTGTIQSGMANTSFPSVSYTPWTPSVKVTWGFVLASVDLRSDSGIFEAAGFTMVNGVKYTTKDFGGRGTVAAGVVPGLLTSYESEDSIVMEDLVMPVTEGARLSITFKVEYSMRYSTRPLWVDGVAGFILVDPIYPETN